MSKIETNPTCVMLDETALYKYSPLKFSNSIRLLDLQPGIGTDPINFTLREIELGTSPIYEAISYAWGDPRDVAEVFCDGKITLVTKNLGDALARLRLKDSTRTLWADAICINQKDDREKSSQVKIMRRIYGLAFRVCVWLGDTTAEMLPAFDLINEISNLVQPPERCMLQSTSGLYSIVNPGFADITEFQDSASGRWVALGTFFSAPWFTRLWVVQEVCDHVCVVYNGAYEISWKDIVKAARLILHLSFACIVSVKSINSLKNIIAVQNIDSGSRLSDPMDVFRYQNCSDQRDKVYALLAFPPLCSLDPPIQPDYSKTVAQVFEDTTVRIFRSSQALGLLSSVEHQSLNDIDWPSWVPRWDCGRTIQVLDRYSSGRANSSFGPIKHKPGILTLGGIHISTLSWHGTLLSHTSGSGTSHVAMFNEACQELLSKFVPKIEHSDDPFLLQTAMTLTFGLDMEFHCPPKDIPQFRSDFLAYLILVSRFLKMLCTTDDLAQTLISEARRGDPVKFWAAAFRACKNKRLFCTENGEFGIGPGLAQAGDHMVLLYGANAPCILRPKGNHYQFVGECYSHFQMHGEAIEDAAKGLVTVEEFEIH